MIRLVVFLLVTSNCCFAQTDYKATLSNRLQQIRDLPAYDNGLVILDESTGYGSTFSNWMAEEEYFLNDMILDKKGTIYESLTDNNKGNSPLTSKEHWKLVTNIPRPYLFLRDSASVDDLKTLVTSDHPYIRTYSFAALVHRKESGLFEILLNNLSDTTIMGQYTSDYEYAVSPPEMMIQYIIDKITFKQKDTLKHLILRKYTHINTLDEILLFHKPIEKEYDLIRNIALTGKRTPHSLIALARYKKPQDIELIKNGFDKIEYYHGAKIFFIAIESFPDPALKKSVIDYQKEININYDYSFDPYYFNALAAYKDKESLDVLRGFVNQKITHRDNRNDNLRVIAKALKKYHAQIYKNLVSDIEKELAKVPNSKSRENYLERSPWNY